jgi:pyruvate/2-oxoglutarate/acetoin dehydrogenase E1 component
MVHVSLQAAEELAKEGLDVEVIDLRSLRPLDEEALVASVSKTHRAVVAYEGWPYGGVGAEVVDRIQRLAFDELDAPIERRDDARRTHALQREARAARASRSAERVIEGGQARRDSERRG